VKPLVARQKSAAERFVKGSFRPKMAATNSTNAATSLPDFAGPYFSFLVPVKIRYDSQNRPVDLISLSLIPIGTIIWQNRRRNNENIKKSLFDNLQGDYNSAELAEMSAEDAGCLLFLSHSCDANTHIAAHDIITARREIAANQPITLHLATWYNRFTTTKNIAVMTIAVI
jgi:hypothetical protein